MTILFVVTYSPWPTVSGGPWRSSKVIEYLSERHDVIVAITQGDPLVEDPFFDAASPAVKRRALHYSRLPLGSRLSAFVENGLLQLDFSPFTERKQWRRSFLEMCESTKPDLVWFSEITAFWRCGEFSGCPVITDMADVQTIKEARTQAAKVGVQVPEMMLGSDNFDFLRRRDLRWRYRRRIAALRLDAAQPGGQAEYADGFLHGCGEATVLQVALAERAMLRASNTVLLANPDDVPYVDSLAKSVVVPNGFDFEASEPSRAVDGKTLVFYGLLTYRPNIDGLKWFCNHVWGQVLERMPTARLEVIGACDERLSFATETPNVTVHGFVPDLTELANRSAALVVPLLSGGGTRIKILEAWARRLPVVSTSVGCEGLGARAGVDLLVADEPSEFARHCVLLLNDVAFGRRLADEGFAHGRRNFDWTKVLPAIDDALEIARSDYLSV